MDILLTYAARLGTSTIDVGQLHEKEMYFIKV
jgi:hypothetical protein